MAFSTARDITADPTSPATRLEPDAIGVAQDTVIGMASSAPNAYRQLDLWTANCGASFECVGRSISPSLGGRTGLAVQVPGRGLIGVAQCAVRSAHRVDIALAGVAGLGPGQCRKTAHNPALGEWESN
jgi:hypothetical protein